MKIIAALVKVKVAFHVHDDMVRSSGGSSIGGARAPPLLKFGDEKKRRKKKKSVKKHYMPNHLNSKYTVLTR